MTLGDLYTIKKATSWQLSPEELRRINEYERRDFTFFRGLGGGSFDTAVDPGSGISTWRALPLMIDLRYPNSVVLEHFKVYLRMLRKDPRANPEDAAKHSPDLAKWASKGLLPCMDLILWAEQQGRKLPSSLVVKAVNPGLATMRPSLSRTAVSMRKPAQDD